jgi:hypothetical protein
LQLGCSLACSCAESYKNTTKMKTYVVSGNTYLCYEGEKYVIVCLSLKEFKNEIITILMKQLHEELLLCTGSLMIESVLKKWFEKVQNGSQEKIIAINNEIDDTKNLMMENLDKVLERGENIDKIASTSNKLQEQASSFKRGAIDLKKEMCLRNWKIIATISLGVLIFILLIVFAILMTKN